MVRPVKKIGIVLTLIILLPALFFSVYELSTLSASETVIEETYSNQLEAILYAVNQFSEEVVSNWANRIDLIIAKKNFRGTDFEKEVTRLQMENPISFIFTADNETFRNINVYNFIANKPSENLSEAKVSEEQLILKLLKENEGRIKRLATYKRGGYRKIEPLQTNLSNNSTLLIFLLDDEREDSYKICGILIDSRIFVLKTLAPRLQEVSQGRFIIAVLKNNTNDQIYSTARLQNANDVQRKSLWLFPSYQLGISLKGETIQSLVRSRYYMTLILISVLNIVLIAGVWFVFRNIKKEIQLAQIKSDFVSNVSHELRTPLALISMFAETLEMGRVKSDERKKEYYGIISHEATRLSRIVNKILSFSQIEAGKRKYNFEETDLNQVVEKVFSTYSFHLQNSGFKFSFVPDENIPLIKVDSEAVCEAVINLVDNAVKYSKDKKEIVVKTGCQDGTLYIEVKDEGIGISAEDQKRIFEKFFRVSSGEIHNSKGTGLGLTLVKHIMEAHKGSISVASAPGKGSAFRLNFILDKKQSV